MYWFLIALIGPFLYALTNHIDKLLLERYFKQGGVGTLIIFSAILSAAALPILFYIDPTAFSIPIATVAILAVVGILNVLVLWCYLEALQEEEASIAVVFYQLVPVFAAIMGYLVLGETLTQLEVIAMAVVIVGASIVSIEVGIDNKFKLRTKTIFLMTIAALMWATESVIFKMVAIEENVWRTLFWEHLMLAVVGVLIFAFIHSYRNHFLEAFRNNSRAIIGLNIGNETLYMAGNVALAYAYMLAPLGLVLLSQSYQPLFVFLIGIFLTLFFPKLGVENIKARHIFQKVLAIAITGIGTYLLFLSE